MSKKQISDIALKVNSGDYAMLFKGIVNDVSYLDDFFIYGKNYVGYETKEFKNLIADIFSTYSFSLQKMALNHNEPEIWFNHFNKNIDGVVAVLNSTKKDDDDDFNIKIDRRIRYYNRRGREIAVSVLGYDDIPDDFIVKVLNSSWGKTTSIAKAMLSGTSNVNDADLYQKCKAFYGKDAQLFRAFISGMLSNKYLESNVLIDRSVDLRKQDFVKMIESYAVTNEDLALKLISVYHKVTKDKIGIDIINKFSSKNYYTNIAKVKDDLDLKYLDRLEQDVYAIDAKVVDIFEDDLNSNNVDEHFNVTLTLKDYLKLKGMVKDD